MNNEKDQSETGICLMDIDIVRFHSGNILYGDCELGFGVLGV